ncbi:MAG: redoxin domain-containing protein [Firmicutes bacterium]|nr:redoxin domain-containing protein [Bacillota bacterium]
MPHESPAPDGGGHPQRERNRRNRPWFVAGLVLLLAAAGFALLRSGVIGPGRTGSALGPLAVPGRAAPDFTLYDLDGKRVELASLKGTPVFLNFWTTWCPPCRQEMPELQRFYAKHGKEVAVLAVNIQESEKTVRTFMDENGYRFPVPMDTKGAVTERYLVRSIPTSIVIDKRGIVRARHLGPLTLEGMEQLLARAIR